jgi:hypothetical protein
LWTGFANLYFVGPGPDGLEGPGGESGPAGPRPVLGGTAGGDLFSVFEIGVIEGRDFVGTDWRDDPEAAIVTERLASELFDGPAVGRTLRVFTGPGTPEEDIRIVGIVESPADLYGEPVAAVFFPAPFLPSATLYVRSTGPVGPLAAAVRNLVAEIDPRVPILELTTLDQKVRAQHGDELAMSRVGALLGIVALLLASIGLYGVTSYSVAMRAREIAVRMALGAQPDSVLAMVLRQAATLVLIGSALGAVAAVAVGALI